MTSPLHFYLTFNPFLNQCLDSGFTQAHEFHEFLKENVKKDKDGYAYWGKIIGKGRESKINIENFQSVITKNKENCHSTHLYISDFAHLWVAKVEEVSKTISKKEMSKTLPFYEDKNVEIWFKISDFELLEYTAEETASKLSEFYIDNDYVENTINGLSPFTTSIRYPTFVQDLAEEMYFDELDNDESTHLVLKGNPAINKTGTTQVLKALHSYAFPEGLYHKLPHSAKAEIEAAELDILENRHHNMGRIAFAYIKALEIVINDLTIHHIKRSGFGDEFFVQTDSMPPKLFLENDRDGLVPISQFQKNYSIGQLIYFIQRCERSSNFCFKKSFQKKKGFVNFLLKDLPKILEENSIIEMRGILAHNNADDITEEDAFAVRNLILGVGCQGLIHLLYQNFFDEEFKFIAKVQNKYGESKSKSKKAA